MTDNNILVVGEKIYELRANMSSCRAGSCNYSPSTSLIHG